MTNQNNLKKLAEQMASSMKSFDDIKDFQKQHVGWVELATPNNDIS